MKKIDKCDIIVIMTNGPGDKCGEVIQFPDNPQIRNGIEEVEGFLDVVYSAALSGEAVRHLKDRYAMSDDAIDVAHTKLSFDTSPAVDIHPPMSTWHRRSKYDMTATIVSVSKKFPRILQHACRTDIGPAVDLAATTTVLHGVMAAQHRARKVVRDRPDPSMIHDKFDRLVWPSIYAKSDGKPTLLYRFAAGEALRMVGLSPNHLQQALSQDKRPLTADLAGFANPISGLLARDLAIKYLQ